MEGFARAIEKTREEALEKSKRKKDTKNTVCLVTTFDQNFNVNKAFKRIQKEKRYLSNTTRGTHLKDVRFQLAFTNALNLRRLLVNKDPREEVQNPEKYKGFSRCSSKCVFCRDVEGESVVKEIPKSFLDSLPDSDSRKKHLLDLKIPTATCSTTNLVYICGCVQCGMFYVGETGNSLIQRCSRHRSQQGDREKFLKDGPDKNWSEVRRHFASENHKKSFWVAPIVVLNEDAPASLQKKKEALWMRRLRPPLNTKHQPKTKTRSRTNSTASNDSPPVSPTLKRKLGITNPRKKFFSLGCSSNYRVFFIIIFIFILFFITLLSRHLSS